MSEIKLRDFQQEAVQATINEFEECKVNSLLINLPTGCGKTPIAAAIAKHYSNKKVLFITNREELIAQGLRTFKLVLGKNASIGICKAEKNDINKRIVIGSIQTCSGDKRLEQLKNQNFEILLIDECHHSIAPTYKKIIDVLGFKDSNKLLVGFTATPDRKGIDDVFQKIVYSRSISTMIKANYLSSVTGRKILTTTSIDGVSISQGDFAVGELSYAINTPERNDFIVQKFLIYAARRKGGCVAFCADVQQCVDLADAFKSQGISAAAVYGSMNKDERKKILKGLKKGTIRVVTSCGVLCEGFDEPSLETILMCRPTRSRSLFIQCIGRGLRRSPETGKVDCLVLDFADNAHNLNAIASLSSTIPDAPLIEEKENNSKEDVVSKPVSVEVVEIADEVYDILGQSRFIWVDIGDNEFSLTSDDGMEIIISPQANGYVAKLYPKELSIVKEPLPLDYCSGVCEDYTRNNLKVSFADTNNNWLSGAMLEFPTPGQIKQLKEHGVRWVDMNKAEAFLKLREIFALKNKQIRLSKKEPATEKQKKLLEQLGIPVNNMSKFEARYKISQEIQRR